MDLWGCAEDFACYVERRGIEKVEDICDILKKGKKDPEYRYFVRNLSYRIFYYTKNRDERHNWYLAEKLLSNSEWRSAIVNVANQFRAARGNFEKLSGVRSEWIKNYYIQ